MRGDRWLAVACASLLAATSCTQDQKAAKRDEQAAAEKSGQAGQAGQPRCPARFDALDDDDDELVSKSEFTDARPRYGRAVAVFAARDADDDKQLTRAEFCAAMRPGAHRPGTGPQLGPGRWNRPGPEESAGGGGS
jgi:hypothetical protein